MSSASGHQPETQPGKAVAEDGVVLLDGPNGVAVAMTPECAEATAESIRQAVEIARTHQSGQT